jgi:hypothetical protein
MTSGVAATLAIVAINDGGTFRLGVINPLVRPLNDGIVSTTAEGGSGAADSAGVIYTGTAASSKAMTVLGYATITAATAGTWAAVPTTLKVGGAAELNDVVPIVTPWVAYTPTFTGFGTPTGVSIWSRRVGDTLHIRGYFTTGTTTATEARISLGFNGTDSNVVSSSTKVAGLQSAGTAIGNAATTSNLYTLIESNVGYLTFGVQNGSFGALDKRTGSSIFSSATPYSLTAEIPIGGW